MHWSNIFFQSYQGSIFTGRDPRIFPFSHNFQSYQGSIFTGKIRRSRNVVLYFQSYQGSIFTRLFATDEVPAQRAFNPIKVLFLLNLC